MVLKFKLNLYFYSALYLMNNRLIIKIKIKNEYKIIGFFFKFILFIRFFKLILINVINFDFKFLIFFYYDFSIMHCDYLIIKCINSCLYFLFFIKLI